MDYWMKWTKTDEKQLKQAVDRFNRVADSANAKDIESVDYSSLKKKIFSRQEFNRQIAKLSRLDYDNAETWAQDEFQREIELSKRRLRRKLKRLELGVDNEDPLEDDEYAIAKGELKNIENLDSLSPAEHERKLIRIGNLASSDFELKEAENYRYWYIRTIDEYYSKYKGYKELRKKLMKYKNPLKFYAKIKGSINIRDIYYIRYSDRGQDMFNKILREWGLAEHEEEIVEKNIEGKKEPVGSGL